MPVFVGSVPDTVLEQCLTSAGEGAMWRETTSGQSDRMHQRPTLGPWEPRGGPGSCPMGKETEKASERRCLLSVLALITLCLCKACGGLGSQGRSRVYYCVPYNLTSSFPSKLTSTRLVIPIHVFIHKYSIILRVLKRYVHSIILCVSSHILLFSVPL